MKQNKYSIRFVIIRYSNLSNNNMINNFHHAIPVIKHEKDVEINEMGHKINLLDNHFWQINNKDGVIHCHLVYVLGPNESDLTFREWYASFKSLKK